MARTIFATDDEIKKYKCLTEMLQLEDLVVVGQEYHEINTTIILICVPRWPVSICPDCSRICQKVHDYPKQRTIHDVPIRGCHTWLIFDSRRFECNFCQIVFTEPIRDVVPECTYTYRLMEELADPRRKQDVATLAETYGLGYKLVESIMLKAARQKMEQRSQEAIQVKVLGIDEISQSKGQGDYVLVLTDLQKRVLLDILPDRNKQTLIAWLEKPPPGIDLTSLETAATDLWSHYRDAVKSVHPAVKVVADRFHVMQNLNETIHKTRRAAQRQARSDEERSKLKGLRYVLIKDHTKLKDTEKERLALLEQSHPELYQLCTLRQQLHDWYEIDTSPALALVSLQTWIDEATALGLCHLDKFCTTLSNWHNEVVNFFANRITSGFVEGMNSKIRLLKRIAFGLPNFEHFRLRMIWACG